MRNFIKLLGFVLIINGCTERNHRVGAIPKNAVWKGGKDGGCWMVFNSVTDAKIDVKIYLEDGSIWEQGVFRKVGNCIYVSERNLINDISSYDGRKVITKNECYYIK